MSNDHERLEERNNGPPPRKGKFGLYGADLIGAVMGEEDRGVTYQPQFIVTPQGGYTADPTELLRDAGLHSEKAEAELTSALARIFEERDAPSSVDDS